MSESPLTFLVRTLFDLYLMVVILRIWLQLVRADFYNPVSQAVVRLTHPIVGPMRRIIPSLGRFDSASLLLALVVSVARFYVLYLMVGLVPNFAIVLITAVLHIVREVFQIMFWVLIIRALLSWISQGANPMEMVLYQLTEPLLAPIRRIIPPIGGLDLSILVLMILLQMVQLGLARWIGLA